MSEQNESAPLRESMGDFAPKIVELTEEVLFGDIWERDGLAQRDRSLITIAALVAGGNFTQLEAHLQIGLRNGLTEDEIIEALTHLAFYAGWPKALSALSTARSVFNR